MKIWATIAEALHSHGCCAMVSVMETQGSTPREAGARMVVVPAGFHGTIGGGTLEWRAIATAQGLLHRGAGTKLTTHALGPDLGQCCGGRVTLLTEVLIKDRLQDVMELAEHEDRGQFCCVSRISGERVIRTVSGELDCETPAGAFREVFGDDSRSIYLFGAGHVGRALILALAPLPYAVNWIDPRPGAFPAAAPGNVTLIQPDDPAHQLADAPSGAFALVMTHSHALDLAIVDTALRNPNIVSVGLIGSSTKRARFEKRLLEAGISPTRLGDLICPIGVAGIHSKAPAVIAASAVAQILIQDEVLKTQSAPAVTPPKRLTMPAGGWTR